MEKIRIGVIGTGHIGTEHTERIMTLLQGATVTACSDIKKEYCQHLLDKFPTIAFFELPEELIASDTVDAVLVTCSNPKHAEYTMRAVECGKPVFCEKPLGVNREEISAIMDKEIAGGKHLVSVGFMRRFDKGYREMKQLLKSGDLGEPLIAYCAHRNVGDWIGRLTPSNAQGVVGTAIHEIDVMSWLLDDPFVSAQALIGKSNATAQQFPGFRDPVILNMRTKSDTMVMLEVNVIAKYGYDINCDIVCEEGKIRMPEPTHTMVWRDGAASTPIEVSWKNRFREAFDAEIQAWIDSIRYDKDMDVANTWDAYRASLMTDACIEAEKTGELTYCGLPECPDFYKK